jgi:nucleotide-binding universal stress UspA family protein
MGEGAMFRKIFCPVDLTHAARLGPAIDVAADLARHYGASVVFAAVSAEAPSEIAHNPDEFRARLDAFAHEQGRKHGIAVEALALFSHDPAIDLDHTLLAHLHDTGADLVVMATHIPKVVDRIWPSNGGVIASRADISVFLVRP